MRLAKNLVSYFVIVTLFAGCSAHGIIPSVELHNNNAFNDKQDNVWDLRVLRWNKEKFSGLLALKNRIDMLSVVLLDPSGIKLFEENISNNGKISRVQAVSFFKENKIPEYLGKAIFRIFRESPDQTSCSGKIYNLCWQEDSNRLIKRARLGPLLLWNSVYLTDKDIKDGSSEISYHSPWTGITLQLKLF